MSSLLGPAYDPTNWSLGYQVRQFGVAADPATGNGTPLIYPSVYSSLAAPPAAMTSAIGKNVLITQTSGKSTSIATPEVVTTTAS